MKLYVIALLGLMSWNIQAQTMQWVPLSAGVNNGACPVEKSKKQHVLCYGLEYTPGVSGALTSYTTAFFVTCTSLGSPVVKNQSCTMSNNVNLINGCSGNGVVLMNSSGNSGNAINNLVTAGVPVILHQVCFSIPYGDSIIITEDQVTDLTTSIDLVNEDIKTEYPEFTEMTVHRRKADVSKPSLLDFKGISLGDFIAQLDWTTGLEVNTSFFDIERSADGSDFISIGRVDAVEFKDRINSYRFLDKNAVLGNNFYRLRQVDVEGKSKYSPVRIIAFVEKPFSVQVSPNPADQFILVEIQSTAGPSTIRLMDVSGRVVIEETTDSNFFKARLDTSKLNAGTYNVIVESGKDKFSGNVVITH